MPINNNKKNKWNALEKKFQKILTNSNWSCVTNPNWISLTSALSFFLTLHKLPYLQPAIPSLRFPQVLLEHWFSKAKILGELPANKTADTSCDDQRIT